MSEAEMLERLQRSLARKTVEVDGETYFVAEGDLLLDADQLVEYAKQRALLESSNEIQRELAALGVPRITMDGTAALTGISQNGKLVRWEEGLVLTYCVLRRTFGTRAEYELARRTMQQATTDWENTCGIQFEHRSQLDDSATTQVAGVVFTVRKLDAGGRFIAAAFFPNDPPIRRRVLLDPSFFAPDLPFDRTGVLRHELGHVIGCRHEHIRSGAPPTCPREDTADIVDLTKYDPQSVMHYFCGGVGSRDLRITELDRIGAQKLYGPPRGSFTFIGMEEELVASGSGAYAGIQLEPAPWEAES
jgi:hypothetical protein